MSNSSKFDSKIYKFLDADKAVRVSFVNATEAVRDKIKVQAMSPIATVMLGRAMVSAALLASRLKEEETISLYFRGAGPLKTVFAEANFEGEVRGYAARPEVETLVKDGRIDFKGAIGRGLLIVVRTHPKRQTPQKGTVEIQSGEVGDDVAFYLQQSEQIRSALSVGVKLDRDGNVLSAGGVLVELMPLATPETEAEIEANFKSSGNITDLLDRQLSPQAVVDVYLKGCKMLEVDHPHSLKFGCKCTRERLLKAMDLFAREDLEDIVKKKENLDARCEFCGQQYQLLWQEVSDVLNKRLNSGLH